MTKPYQLKIFEGEGASDPSLDHKRMVLMRASLQRIVTLAKEGMAMAPVNQRTYLLLVELAARGGLIDAEHFPDRGWEDPADRRKP